MEVNIILRSRVFNKKTQNPSALKINSRMTVTLDSKMYIGLRKVWAGTVATSISQLISVGNEPLCEGQR